LATLVLFTGVYPAGNSTLGLAMVMLCFSFFWNAALPQFEAITLNHLGVNAHRYSSIRLWGSVGFVAAALLVGTLVQHLTIQIVPAVLLGLFLALWVNSLLVPEDRKAHKSTSHDPFLYVLRRPAVIALFLVCFLSQASHGPYYAFFSIYLEDLGYSRMSIGGLWDLGVVAEIGMFLLMPRLLLRFAARQLMLLALAFTSLRWLLIGGFADNLALLLFAQTLHALSFGAYHVIAIHLIHRFFSGHHQGRGQALYSSLSFGAGGALGSLAAGYLWTVVGAQGTYFLAAGLSALGFIVAWVGLRSE
jgi:PPP family 3-phenylpropionic acid transporter